MTEKTSRHNSDVEFGWRLRMARVASVVALSSIVGILAAQLSSHWALLTVMAGSSSLYLLFRGGQCDCDRVINRFVSSELQQQMRGGLLVAPSWQRHYVAMKVSGDMLRAEGTEIQHEKIVAFAQRVMEMERRYTCEHGQQFVLVAMPGDLT